MSDGIGLQLFEQNGVMMAEAPDGSVYRLADVMRHNDPDTAYDDATGARVADLEQAQSNSVRRSVCAIFCGSKLRAARAPILRIAQSDAAKVRLIGKSAYWILLAAES